MERLKTLFITYAYPPLKFPRSVQISHLVQYLRNTMDVTVVASSPDRNIDHSSLEFTPLDNVIYPSKAFFTCLFDKVGGYRIKKKLFPDVLYLESCDLYHAARKHLDNERYQSFVTFGQPMSVHISGLKLKKVKPDVRWVAHFSDPWVDNPYNTDNRWVQFLNRCYQKKVFQQADKLVFTSPETVDLVMKNCNSAIRNKAVILPHSFNPDLYPEQPPKAPQTLIRYLGNFYGGRQPESLFQALEIIKSGKQGTVPFKVELVGTSVSLMDQIKERKLEDTVTVRSSVGYLESLKLMSESDMLLVIDAPMELSPFFPSKLADYIGANRPLFGITPSGASKRIIEELGFLTADPKNPQEIAQKLLETIRRIQEHKCSVLPKELSTFSIATVGPQMAQILCR